MMSFLNVADITYRYPLPEIFDEPLSADQKENRSRPEQAPALDGVSLSVEVGQFICILGRNGSGKSTLARQLNALLFPDEGTVFVDGMDTKKEEYLWNIRAAVGMVFQNPDNQIIGSVVEEDVAFGLENLGIPSEEIQARVRAVLEEVGLSAYAKHSPNHLSGGQKQRVAVAGVLAMEPKCIVLDEATAMLDPKGRREVMNMAMQLNQEKGITVIAITHYMEEALAADQVFVMDRGRIAMQGSLMDIFSHEEEVEALGLRLPSVCRLANRLRREGIPVPKGIFTAEELAEYLKHRKASFC